MTWDVATGTAITCAVRVDDYIQCWGYTESMPEFIPDAVKLRASQVSAGTNHTCAIKGGNLDCIGSNDFGQLEEPREVENVRLVSAGYNYNCAITNNPKLDILTYLNGKTNGIYNLVNPTSNSPLHTLSNDPSGSL